MASSVPNVKPDGFHVWVDNPDAKVSIIFVQGLDAHPYYTWLWQRPLASSSKLKVGVGSSNDSKRECFWITELLPRHLPNAHIATYAYQTRWRCKDFATGLRECGDRLLQYVELDWMPNNGGRPIILIGHSFGGLVMQQALITANHGTVHQPFREAVSGIMFLGVPMQGSTLASVGSWVERMMNSSAGLMKTLKRDSPELRGLLSDFHAAYCHLPITCFTEHKKSLYGPLEIQTVTDNSSTILGRAEVFLDTDHSGLNKFSGDEDKDENFHRFIVKLKQYANFVIGAAAQRQEHGTYEDKLRRKRVIDWLDPPNPFTNYHKARSQWQKGTGQWLIDSQAFLRWKSDSATFLWLYGMPGCGKTVLSSTILDHLHQRQKNDGSSILFFYFDFADVRKQKLDDCIRSLLGQLCSTYVRASTMLYAWYQSCGDGHRQASTSELQSLFFKLIQDLGDFWIVLDALDESTSRIDGLGPNISEFLKKTTTKSVHSTSSGSVHLLVTSRPEYRIDVCIRSWARKESLISLQSAAVTQDIDHYIRRNVREAINMKKWHKRSEVLAEIESQLSQNADGMFRWVSCQLDVLGRCRDLRSLRKALQSLPKTLDETYGRILRNIPDEDTEKAARLLQLLLCNDQPLRLDDAIDAIAVDLEPEPGFDPDSRLEDPTEIITFCPNLITIVVVNEKIHGHAIHSASDSDSDFISKRLSVRYVRLAHFSVREYLISMSGDIPYPFQWQERLARSSIAQICIAYLLCIPLDTKELCDAEGLVDPEAIALHYPFVFYCAAQWASHLRAAQSIGPTTKADTMALELLQDNAHRRTWLAFFHPDCTDDQSISPKAHENLTIPPLYIAAMLGLKNQVVGLLDADHDGNGQGGLYGTALQAAIYSGHMEVVQLLLDRAVDINLEGGFFGSALQAAISKGCTQLVRRLLDAGANIHIKNQTGDSAFIVAVRSDQAEIVRLLLDRGADIHVRNRRGITALITAIHTGQAQMVRLLLQKGADSNGCDEHGSTPLAMASYSGHGDIVNLLLDNGASINAEDENFGGALQAAVILVNEHWFWETDPKRGETTSLQLIQLLLDRGADINAEGGTYGSTLQAAAGHSDMGLIQFLLDKGANVNPERGKEGGPLQIASSRGSLELVQLLLGRGAKINAHDGKFGTALNAAASRGRIQVVRLLLHHGADLNISNPLRTAVVCKFPDIVELLLENGARVDDREILDAAAESGELLTVKLLLKKGAGMEDRNSFLRTALNVAALEGWPLIVKLLLDEGAIFDCQSVSFLLNICLGSQEVGRLLLYEVPNNGEYDRCIWSCCVAQVGTAAEITRAVKDLDFSSRDKLGRSLLHFAALNRNEGSLEFMLQRFDEVDETDHWGWTPLHWAVHGANGRAVQILMTAGADAYIKDLSQKDLSQIAYVTGDRRIVNVVGEIFQISKARRKFARRSKRVFLCGQCQQNTYDELHTCIDCAREYLLCHRCFREVDQIHPEHMSSFKMKDIDICSGWLVSVVEEGESSIVSHIRPNDRRRKRTPFSLI